MSKRAPLIFLVLAVFMAGAAAWAAHHWMSGQSAQAKRPQIKLVPVVVAARVLPAGKTLEKTDLAVQKWPVRNLPKGHFKDPGKATGRVIRGPMFAGEVVLAAKLAPTGAAGGLSAVVPQGFRAMTVKVNEVIGVGGFVQPGDRVDVLATIDQGAFRDDPVCRIVLQDIPVLTVGERVQRKTGDGKAQKTKVKVVTLQVKPVQAERLALAANEGKVVLALRNQTDRQNQDTRGEVLTELAPSAVKSRGSAKAKAATGPNQGVVVEVLKGVKLTRQTL